MGTSEESKAECVAAMGEALGTQYAELWQELAQLHITWLEFVEPRKICELCIALEDLQKVIENTRVIEGDN